MAGFTKEIAQESLGSGVSHGEKFKEISITTVASQYVYFVIITILLYFVNWNIVFDVLKNVSGPRNKIQNSYN